MKEPCDQGRSPLSRLKAALEGGLNNALCTLWVSFNRLISVRGSGDQIVVTYL